MDAALLFDNVVSNRAGSHSAKSGMKSPAQKKIVSKLPGSRKAKLPTFVSPQLARIREGLLVHQVAALSQL